MSSTVRQKTLKNAIGCSGVGLHTGIQVTMMICPAEADSGIRFKRTDISGGQAIIAGTWRNIIESKLCSTVANEDGVEVKTIEHLMAAFAGLGIDNVLVEINGREIPIMDGSAAPFVFLIECAGILEQDRPRRAVKILKPVIVSEARCEAALVPGEGFSVAFDIEFNSPLVASQYHYVEFTDGAFKKEISSARTFGFEHEVAALRAGGMLLGGSLDNAVVVSGEKVLNDSGLRYGNEFVRHKILDSVGDLYLAGAPIIGHFRGSRSGHAMNHRLLEALFADADAWTMVPMTRERARTPDAGTGTAKAPAEIAAAAGI
ncbi:MAG: UDP-3-O-acyl-N-acetylglucosamine deacetylase [Alphaproteobacteria bacterium]|nr:UDP-3-O-acyl-N-acetylglucosamine deacetylase [Pseudomonadota bacterium]MCH8998394.1 UDP-3-O-acyl-N-acetylglucosamine deacetylase [Pseudomonadota bacterium]TDI63703.1 MAG: UDP-3-O-acyl-N-acetylglucosamine deacetylase [Alphaproteobacteria bacterium]